MRADRISDSCPSRSTVNVLLPERAFRFPGAYTPDIPVPGIVTISANRFVLFGGPFLAPVVHDSLGQPSPSSPPRPPRPLSRGTVTLAALGGDSIWVADPAAESILLLGPPPRLDTVSIHPLKFRPLGEVIFIGGRLLANAAVGTAERAGIPLHVMTTQGVPIFSFGEERTPGVLIGPQSLVRIVGQDGANLLVSKSAGPIEVFDGRGSLVDLYDLDAAMMPLGIQLSMFRLVALASNGEVIQLLLVRVAQEEPVVHEPHARSQGLLLHLDKRSRCIVGFAELEDRPLRFLGGDKFLVYHRSQAVWSLEVWRPTLRRR